MLFILDEASDYHLVSVLCKVVDLISEHVFSDIILIGVRVITVADTEINIFKLINTTQIYIIKQLYNVKK